MNTDLANQFTSFVAEADEAMKGENLTREDAVKLHERAIQFANTLEHSDLPIRYRAQADVTKTRLGSFLHCSERRFFGQPNGERRLG